MQTKKTFCNYRETIKKKESIFHSGWSPFCYIMTNFYPAVNTFLGRFCSSLDIPGAIPGAAVSNLRFAPAANNPRLTIVLKKEPSFQKGRFLFPLKNYSEAGKNY